MYEVHVGNVGCVAQTKSRHTARNLFADYCELVREKGTRAYGESVTLFLNGELIDEYTP